jgi:hypothetical protein
MHFPTWRPVNGWRAFAGEVGIIVLGVVIALLLGAMANEIGWRIEVAKAREQIRDELSFNFELLDRKERRARCVAKQLDEIGALMVEASRTRRLPPLGGINGAATTFWPRGILESQMAAQTMAHYPAREAAGLNRVYRRFQALAEADAVEQQAWDVLSMLKGPGRALDADTEGKLYAALAQARNSNKGIPYFRAGVRKVLADTLGSDYPKSAGLRPVSASSTICKRPSSTIPATY